MRRQQAAADFRVPLPKPGEEHLLLTPGSCLRQQLVVPVGAERFSSGPVMTGEQRRQLDRAAEWTLVGETADKIEAGLAFAELVQDEPEFELIAGTSVADNKTYIAKGQESLDPSLENVNESLLPFDTAGWQLHTHPVHTFAMPSMADYYVLLSRAAPFGLIFTPKYQDGLRLAKYYVLGPFVCFEMFFSPHRDGRRALLKALTSDGKGPPCVFITLGHQPGMVPLTREAQSGLLSAYAQSMERSRDRIAELQDCLFLNPEVDLLLARELAGLYISTQHHLNALLLIERWPMLAKDPAAKRLRQTALKTLFPLAFL